MLGMAAGEVHLETIIKDLRDRFACVDIRVSPPLVAFRESVYIEEEAPEPQHKPAKVLLIGWGCFLVYFQAVLHLSRP